MKIEKETNYTFSHEERYTSGNRYNRYLFVWHKDLESGLISSQKKVLCLPLKFYNKAI